MFFYIKNIITLNSQSYNKLSRKNIKYSIINIFIKIYILIFSTKGN
jgi:hypothetical protein